MVGGVVTLWRMSWKHLTTFGTHLFLSKSDGPAVVRQAVSICLSLRRTQQTHTHILSLSVVLETPEKPTILFDFVCWEEAAYISQQNGFKKYCFSRLIVLGLPFLTVQPIKLSAQTMQYPPSQQNTFTTRHPHGEGTQTVVLAICTRKRRPGGGKNKISQKTWIIITTVQSF